MITSDYQTLSNKTLGSNVHRFPLTWLHQQATYGSWYGLTFDSPYLLEYDAISV